MKKDRIVSVTYIEETADPKVPVYFMEFIQEAARVKNEKEIKNSKNKEAC